MLISEISIHRPIFATVLSMMLLVVGLIGLVRLWAGIRELPDVNPPVVSIETRYRGASPQIIETKVTQPIEDRIAGIEHIDKLRSSSMDERSQISVEFDLDRDIDEAANDIRDRVGRVVNTLPDEADPPEISKADANAEPIIFINLSSDALGSLELTDYAERYVVDRFAALPGVARVRLTGDRRYAMRIWIDRTALAARALTVTDVEAALRKENVQIPAGRIESSRREFVLNTETGFETPDDFRNLVIGRGPDGYLVKLQDVADVQLAAENERTIARTNRIAGVTVGLEAQANANALEVAKAARAEIAALNKDLPAGTRLGINIDRAVFIEASLHEVLRALAISFSLVLAVMYAFLGNWRATLIPAITIPISILAACAAMSALGFTLNVLTLLGMVLAIGLVVDDAIVVLENIYRRIERGEPSLLAAIDGSREIGFAVIATTLVLSAVFVPISFLGGRVGRLFSEFGFTLAAAILFSCLIALTLTPMLTSQLFRQGATRSKVSDRVGELFRALSHWYEGMLRTVLKHCWAVVIVASVAFVGAIALLSTFRSESTPTDDRGAVRIVLQGPEGASLAYMDGYARQLEDIIEQETVHGDIQRFNIRVPGGGGGGGGVGEVNRAQAFVVLTDWDKRERSAGEIAASLRRKVSEFPGVRASVVTPTAFNWGGSDPFKAVIEGPDYETLSKWASTLVAEAQGEPGFLSLDTDYKERKPQIKVSIDRARAAELGVSLESIGRTLETMMGSRIVTTFIKSGREYYVILQGRSEDRASPTDLDNLYVRSDRGSALIPLASVVKLQELATSSQRNRFDRLRAISVSATLAPNYSMGEAVDFFTKAVEAKLPPTAKLSFDGEASEYLKSSQSMYWTLGGALLVVFLVLAAQFESFTLPFVIMTTVPLAMVGAAVGMWLHGITINIYSQVAVVMLIGLAAKNGVLIVEFANQLRDRGVEFSQAIVQAASTRLRPVLMTSLCSGFGAIPLLLAVGAGAENRKPIGSVVLYGVLISMVLTLVVVPAVYSLVARNTRSPRYWTRLIETMRSAEKTLATAPGGRAAESPRHDLG
jgi:hydrophobe/amphiphile efflux-1 (HAE1) family protein